MYGPPNLVLKAVQFHKHNTHTHTHTHTYIYIYMCVCVCVCTCFVQILQQTASDFLESFYCLLPALDK